MAGKFTWGNKANFLFSKVCWHHLPMFCLNTSSKHSPQLFEFSLKVKVMGSNPDYLLKSFLLYIKLHKTSTSLCVAKMCDVRRMKLPAYKLRKKMSLTVGHWGTKYWYFFWNIVVSTYFLSLMSFFRLFEKWEFSQSFACD